jgi:hypothetical protein
VTPKKRVVGCRTCIRLHGQDRAPAPKGAGTDLAGITSSETDSVVLLAKRLRENVNGLLVATLTLETYYPGDLREESIVPAQTHVFPGIYARPPLTHDDAAGHDRFAPVGFDAQPLAM